MSADNYYEINTEQREDGTFRFGVNMGFASDERKAPVPNGPRTRWFDDLDSAISAVADDYAEYGWSLVHNEAWDKYEDQLAEQRKSQASERDEKLRAEGAAAERERIATLLSLLADYRSEYGSKSDLESTNYSLRQNALMLSVSIDTMRIAARVVEKNDVEEVQGYLPSWRWGSKELKATGIKL